MESPKKKIWPVAVTEATRYRASLIAALYKMKIGDVIDRAIVAYANILRVGDKLEQEFPKDGIETPPKSGPPRRPPSLRKFQEHTDFFKNRRTPPAKPPEEPS